MASKQAQRMAARAQLQQRMAQKAAEEQKRRTVFWSIGGVAALVALVLIAWGAVAIFSGDDDTDTPAAGESPSASESASSDAAAGPGNDASIEQTLANAKAAASRCKDAEPSGDGATADDAGSTDGRPAMDVYLECMSLSKPDVSKTADCTYTATGDAEVPPTTEPAAGEQTMKIVTNLGVMTANIDTANAPCTAGAFTYLAAQGYFDNSQCHRLTTDGIWVLQCGDPTAREAIEGGNPQSAGTGGPGFQYEEENMPADGDGNYPAGTLAMANAGAGTTGSQFFIVYQDSTLSPAAYTVLGQITDGLDLVEQVAAAGVQ